MTTKLFFSVDAGFAEVGQNTWAIRHKPTFGFGYDAVSFDIDAGSKTIDGTTTALTPEESSEVAQWVSANNPHANSDELVHGVDADGYYLGLVLASQAAVVLLSGPPPGSGWRWSSEEGWARELTLAQAKAAALIDIDAAADAVYSTALGERDTEYAIAKDHAVAFASTGFTGTPPLSVTNQAQITGQSNQDAAVSILQASQSVESVTLATRLARLTAKNAVTVAGSFDALEIAMTQYQTALDAIKQTIAAEAWIE